jgi:hypothetical protein
VLDSFWWIWYNNSYIKEKIERKMRAIDLLNLLLEAQAEGRDLNQIEIILESNQSSIQLEISEIEIDQTENSLLIYF